MVFRNKGINNAKESRKEKFKRIASRRVQELLDKIRLLKNCSSRSSYAYTDEQVSKVFATINSELKSAREAFNRNKRKKKGFSL